MNDIKSIILRLRRLFYLFFSLVIGVSCSLPDTLNDLDWEEVVYEQEPEWYGSPQAIAIAENVLLYQRDVGGWPKKKEMHQNLSTSKKQKLRKLQSKGIGATIDNDATVTELDYLSKVYENTKDQRFKSAFLKGINYLFEAQYENGGWPQFYPLEVGEYSTHITYNDDAMVNVLHVIKDIASVSDRFSIEFCDTTIEKAATAFEKGIECILKTQYVQDSVLTVWCAQHDEYTFKPADARSYELASLSGAESADIVRLLMEIENPSPEIIIAIQSAVLWFEKVKISGIRIERYKKEDGKKDCRVVEDKDAPVVWARFYGLNDNRPFFCDRDGVKKYSMAEIGRERRSGYGWYSDSPQDVLEDYLDWKSKWIH